MMVLAVDAGGTHCRMALITKDKTETVSSGAANASTDIEATAKSIRAALALLANKTSLSISQLNETPAYLGVAGVTESGVAQSLAVRLAFRQVRIEGDRQSVLRGALGTMDGCIAHCGTGSFFARQKNVVAQFAGGWGPTLDDVASAHWVGIRALRSTLYAHDELTPQTNLTRSLLSDFGSTSAIVAHARDASVSDIAALAKIVTGHADQNDSTAIAIMQRGASIIEERLTQLGFIESDAVCLTGGLAPHYKTYLTSQLQKNLTNSIGEPLDGAIALAKEFYLELYS